MTKLTGLQSAVIQMTDRLMSSPHGKYPSTSGISCADDSQQPGPADSLFHLCLTFGWGFFSAQSQLCVSHVCFDSKHHLGTHLCHRNRNRCRHRRSHRRRNLDRPPRQAYRSPNRRTMHHSCMARRRSRDHDYLVQRQRLPDRAKAVPELTHAAPPKGGVFLLTTHNCVFYACFA